MSTFPLPRKCMTCPNSDNCYEKMLDLLEEEYLKELYSLKSVWELINEGGEGDLNGLLTDLHADF